MKIKLEFDESDVSDMELYRCMIQSKNTTLALWQFDQRLRNIVKHEERVVEPVEIRKLLHDVLEEYNVDLDVLS